MAANVARACCRTFRTLKLSAVASGNSKIHCIRDRLQTKRLVHSSSTCFGLEEFFPDGALESGQPIEEEVKVGRKWKIDELRQKSFSDLHKLWYVMLKERNMLLTVREEAKRLGIPMPGPTRLDKVEGSMKVIRTVIKEREEALKEMESATYDFDNASNDCFPDVASVTNDIDSKERETAAQAK